MTLNSLHIHLSLNIEEIKKKKNCINSQKPSGSKSELYTRRKYLLYKKKKKKTIFNIESGENLLPADKHYKNDKESPSGRKK